MIKIAFKPIYSENYIILIGKFTNRDRWDGFPAGSYYSKEYINTFYKKKLFKKYSDGKLYELISK